MILKGFDLNVLGIIPFLESCYKPNDNNNFIYFFNNNNWRILLDF